jgi:hypothetical protein
MRNKNDPTGFDVPFLARKKEAKLFGDLNDFHFEDGHTFDFRGEAARSAEERGERSVIRTSAPPKAFGTPSRSLKPSVGSSVNTNSTGFS